MNFWSAITPQHLLKAGAHLAPSPLGWRGYRSMPHCTTQAAVPGILHTDCLESVLPHPHVTASCETHAASHLNHLCTPKLNLSKTGAQTQMYPSSESPSESSSSMTSPGVDTTTYAGTGGGPGCGKATRVSLLMFASHGLALFDEGLGPSNFHCQPCSKNVDLLL